MQILIVDDVPTRSRLVRQFLQRDGYEVAVASTLAAGSRQLATAAYQFVLLARQLPDGDGLSWLRQTTEQAEQTASFILLSATEAVEERLQGFAAGADDCLAPSVTLLELEGRLRSIARQRVGRQRPEISFGGGFSLDLAGRALRHGRHTVDLSRSQFDLLHYLLRHRGQPLTRRQLGSHIGKEDTHSNCIDVHIMNMRKALARFAPTDFLQTVRGIGYQVA